MTPKHPAESLTILTDLVLPSETNPLNNLFGGELLARMDRAASIAAGRHSRHARAACRNDQPVAHFPWRHPTRLRTPRGLNPWLRQTLDRRAGNEPDARRCVIGDHLFSELMHSRHH